MRTEFHRRSGIIVEKAPDAMWLEARRVVREGLADVARGTVISVPSPMYKGLAWLARIAPRRLVRSGGKLTSHRPPLR